MKKMPLWAAAAIAAVAIAVAAGVGVKSMTPAEPDPKRFPPPSPEFVKHLKELNDAEMQKKR